MGSKGFAHFSLAEGEAIGDNPALSHSGGARANVKRPSRAGHQGQTET